MYKDLPYVASDTILFNQVFVCYAGFRLKFKLQSHLDNHDGIYRHQCDYCSKGFLEKAKLNRHIKQIHMQEPAAIRTKIVSL